jgi:hypothetical protein
MDPKAQMFWFLLALISFALAAPIWPIVQSRVNLIAVGLFCFTVVFFWTAWRQI